ncbi:MAG: class I SAM-dependent methyltransferase [bacterium]
MANWFETLSDEHWLLPDDSGEEEARFIKKIARLRKGQKVLDAPCGAGRIAFHLASWGCDISGIDLRRKFIQRAQRRFRKHGLPGSFRVLDMRDLDFVGEFSCIYNWGGSFGYFSDKENLQLLRIFARALKRGGRLVVDQVHREHLLRHFLPVIQRGEVTVHNRWDATHGRIISHREVDGKRDPRNLSAMRLYTRRETERLFEQAGLAVEHVYGWHPAGEFSRSSRRMVIVGRKE